MKPFTLFFGASGQLGTSDVTHNSQYELVVNTVNQLRDRLLKEEVLRQPFLHIFNTTYNDNTDVPHDLEPCTPLANQVSNMSKFQNIRNYPPTDNDVVDFLTNSFPDLYMAPGNIGPEDVSWHETWSGQGEADKEKIAINCRLVQLWLQAVSTVDVQCILLIISLSQASTPMVVGPSRLQLMFIAVFLHELGHSSLVWYSMHQENHFFPEGTHSRPWIPRGCQESQGVRAPWSASRYRFLFLISQGQPEVVLGLSWGTLSCP
jgi:hypothetical protein